MDIDYYLQLWLEHEISRLGLVIHDSLPNERVLSLGKFLFGLAEGEESVENIIHAFSTECRLPILENQMRVIANLIQPIEFILFYVFSEHCTRANDFFYSLLSFDSKAQAVLLQNVEETKLKIRTHIANIESDVSDIGWSEISTTNSILIFWLTDACKCLDIIQTPTLADSIIALGKLIFSIPEVSTIVDLVHAIEEKYPSLLEQSLLVHENEILEMFLYHIFSSKCSIREKLCERIAIMSPFIQFYLRSAAEEWKFKIFRNCNGNANGKTDNISSRRKAAALQWALEHENAMLRRRLESFQSTYEANFEALKAERERIETAASELSAFNNELVRLLECERLQNDSEDSTHKLSQEIVKLQEAIEEERQAKEMLFEQHKEALAAKDEKIEHLEWVKAQLEGKILLVGKQLQNIGRMNDDERTPLQSSPLSISKSTSDPFASPPMTSKLKWNTSPKAVDTSFPGRAGRPDPPSFPAGLDAFGVTESTFFKVGKPSGQLDKLIYDKKSDFRALFDEKFEAQQRNLENLFKRNNQLVDSVREKIVVIVGFIIVLTLFVLSSENKILLAYFFHGIHSIVSHLNERSLYFRMYSTAVYYTFSACIPTH